MWLTGIKLDFSGSRRVCATTTIVDIHTYSVPNSNFTKSRLFRFFSRRIVINLRGATLWVPLCNMLISQNNSSKEMGVIWNVAKRRYPISVTNVDQKVEYFFKVFLAFKKFDFVFDNQRTFVPNSQQDPTKSRGISCARTDRQIWRISWPLVESLMKKSRFATWFKLRPQIHGQMRIRNIYSSCY